MLNLARRPWQISRRYPRSKSQAVDSQILRRSAWVRQRTNKQAEFARRGPIGQEVCHYPTLIVRRPICSFLVSRERAEVVPRLAKKGELVLHGNLSCSHIYNGCHTSFDQLLLAE